MMRIPVLLASVASLCACVAAPEPAVEMEASARVAIEEAMRTAPAAEPITIGLLTPPTRRETEIRALSHEALARWILPDAEAAQVVRTELRRGRMPQLTGIALYAAPVATAHPGLCAVRGWDAWLRVPNESSLSYEQHLDPPLQPFQYTPALRYRILGSTVAAARMAPPDCAAALLYNDWFEGPSAQAVHRAANLVEQAQQSTRGVRLACQRLRHDETRGLHPVACTDAEAVLQRLTPDLIKRVRPADCDVAPSDAGCLGIEYHDPYAPGTHSFYAVTVPNEARPRFLQITQGMMPPH